MSSPRKLNFSLSKFPEGGLIIVIIVLGLLLAIFGGSVRLPKMQTTPDGKRERVFETNDAGQKVPAFESVNKFFNARTLVQIAKDTSFFAIMAVGMTCPSDRCTPWHLYAGRWSCRHTDRLGEAGPRFLALS